MDGGVFNTERPYLPSHSNNVADSSSSQKQTTQSSALHSRLQQMCGLARKALVNFENNKKRASNEFSLCCTSSTNDRVDPKIFEILTRYIEKPSEQKHLEPDKEELKRQLPSLKGTGVEKSCSSILKTLEELSLLPSSSPPVNLVPEPKEFHKEETPFTPKEFSPQNQAPSAAAAASNSPDNDSPSGLLHVPSDELENLGAPNSPPSMPLNAPRSYDSQAFSIKKEEASLEENPAPNQNDGDAQQGMPVPGAAFARSNSNLEGLVLDDAQQDAPVLGAAFARSNSNLEGLVPDDAQQDAPVLGAAFARSNSNLEGLMPDANDGSAPPASQSNRVAREGSSFNTDLGAPPGRRKLEQIFENFLPV